MALTVCPHLWTGGGTGERKLLRLSTGGVLSDGQRRVALRQPSPGRNLPTRQDTAAEKIMKSVMVLY
jgi:hypothetical protein